MMARSRTMIAASQKPLDANERALQLSLDNIQRAIKKTLKTIEWVEDNKVAERGPLQPVFSGGLPQLIFTSHNDTSNPSPIGVRDALVNHLRLLLKLQQSQATAFRQRHAWLVLQNLTKEAETSSSALRAHAKRKLGADARKTGEPSPAVLAGLRKEADHALVRCVTVLDANPSRKAFGLTLKALEDSMLLGSSIDAEAPGRALVALRVAATKRLRRALADFRAQPTEHNAKILAEWIVRAQQLGCSSEVTQPAIDALQAKLAGGAQPKLPGPSQEKLPAPNQAQM
jgi:hypothetical protein